jgi:cytochrome c-type biogenesis protein CcmF
MSRDSVPVALVSLVRRNRRRYGGYIVHCGIAILFVGVAASSAFQTQHLVELRPGQSDRVGNSTITYERPTSKLVAADNGRLERIDLGARLVARRGDGAPEVLDTYKSYFPSMADDLGPVSRFFEGEATSEVALRAGFRQDLWAAVAPDIGRLRPMIEKADGLFTDDLSDVTPAQFNSSLVAVLRALEQSYTDNPPAATFRFIVSPLVTWIWFGALIVFGGATIALWPAGARARRPATAAGLARVARELERA